jgi:hypothetical protein
VRNQAQDRAGRGPATRRLAREISVVPISTSRRRKFSGARSSRVFRADHLFRQPSPSACSWPHGFPRNKDSVVRKFIAGRQPRNVVPDCRVATGIVFFLGE